MKKHLKPAIDVMVGEYILTPYHPTVWMLVTRWVWDTEGTVPIRIDTDRNRTWWLPEDPIWCRTEP